MSLSVSPDKVSSSISAKISTQSVSACSFCFSHMSLCRCSPYKVTAHRLQTKDVPQLEHDLRERDAQVQELTEMLHAANHKYDDVTQPLIAQVAELTGHVKALNLKIAKRDEKIRTLQGHIQEQRMEEQKAQAQISDLKHSNESLACNIRNLVQYDICQAAKRGDLDLVALWLSLGCDVNKRDHECANKTKRLLLSCLVNAHFTESGPRSIGHREADVVTLQKSWCSTEPISMQKMTSKMT